MKRDVVIYIRDILENMELAEDFVKGMTYEEFVSDTKTNHAVIRCIEIMGEAALKPLIQKVLDDMGIKTL